jgi:hypothetical protein
MNRALDPAVAAKLAKVLGLLGSAHDGERAAAGLLANRIVRDASLDWNAVLGVADGAEDAPPSDRDDLARWTLARLRRVNDRERDFLDAIATSPWPPTEKQRLRLDALARRAAAGEGRP